MTSYVSFVTGPIDVFILLVLAIALVFDVRAMRIPNWLTFPAIATGIFMSTVASGKSGLLSSASGLLLGIALFAIPVAWWGRGAGDLKLLAAIGALGGPGFALWTALLTGVAGGLLAIAVLHSRQMLGVVLAGMTAGSVSREVPFATSNIKIPYGVAIAAGAVMALLLR